MDLPILDIVDKWVIKYVAFVSGSFTEHGVSGVVSCGSVVTTKCLYTTKNIPPYVRLCHCVQSTYLLTNIWVVFTLGCYECCCWNIRAQVSVWTRVLISFSYGERQFYIAWSENANGR